MRPAAAAGEARTQWGGAPRRWCGAQPQEPDRRMRGPALMRWRPVLRWLQRAADNGTLIEIAARSHLSQSGVSRALARLARWDIAAREVRSGVPDSGRGRLRSAVNGSWWTGPRGDFLTLPAVSRLGAPRRHRARSVLGHGRVAAALPRRDRDRAQVPPDCPADAGRWHARGDRVPPRRERHKPRQRSWTTSPRTRCLTITHTRWAMLGVLPAGQELAAASAPVGPPGPDPRRSRLLIAGRHPPGRAGRDR
jgi:hypothetical protein